VFSPGEGASVALQRSVRALDQVERIGRLLTLDLKGNDIKVSQDVQSTETSGREPGVAVIRLSEDEPPC
jgi:hypothetical protein